MSTPIGRITTTKNGPQSKGIHGGNTYRREKQPIAKPDRKASAKLQRRQKDFMATVQSEKGYTMPGSLNRANR